jgi:hypothetical protein
MYFITFILLAVNISLFAETWTPKISIKNGTTNGAGKADVIRLFALDGGMVPIGEFKDKSGSFNLGSVTTPDGAPVLIQVSYKNANYNKMVPPSKDLRDKVMEVVVYDTVSDFSNIDIKSVIQIVREIDQIVITKFYVFTNNTNPPKSFYEPQNLQIFIPENAENVTGQITQEGKMNIQLDLKKGDKGRIFERGILPGISELQVSYTIPAKDGKDAILEDKLLFEKDPNRIIFLKSQDMKILSDNSKVSPMPEVAVASMTAYKVEYPSNGSAKLTLSGGTPATNAAMEQPDKQTVENAKLFVSIEKSLLGIFAVVALLFGLSFIFVFNKNK